MSATSPSGSLDPAPLNDTVRSVIPLISATAVGASFVGSGVVRRRAVGYGVADVQDGRHGGLAVTGFGGSLAGSGHHEDHRVGLGPAPGDR